MPEKKEYREVKVGWQKLKTVEEAEAEGRALMEKALAKATSTETAGK